MISFLRQYRKEIIAIIVLWLGVHVYLFYHFGVFTSLEASKYTSAGKYFLETGSFPEKKYLFYALTPLLIALNLKIGFGYTGAAIMQCLISLASTLIFFRLCLLLSGNKKASLITTVILLLFIPYQSWNVYLYTESLFLSAVIFLLYALYNLSIEKKSFGKNILKVLIALVLVLTARPFGMLFLPSVVLYSIMMLPRRYFFVSIGITIVAVGAMYYFLNRAFSGSVDWNSMVSNINGNIICDLPDARFIKRLNLANDGDPVYQLLYYVIYNPKHFLTLSLMRLSAFFNITRSYYSTPHNALLVLCMIVIYGFVVIGIKAFSKNVNSRFAVFIFSGIVFYTAAITLQCDDYHSRFIMALIPFFLLIGLFGIVNAAEFFQQKFNITVRKIKT
jgi:hypothetical protein